MLFRMRCAAGFVALLICAQTSVADTAAGESGSNAAGPRVGLVLSGGGARGAAHIGVLRALEELRIPVHAIAGTSMGAIVGGLYASGLDAASIEKVLTRIDWDEVFRDDPRRANLAFRRKEDDLNTLIKADVGLQDGKLVLPRGLVQGQNLNLELRKLTLRVAGIDDFDQLPIPFRAVATDIANGRAVVMGEGDLALAMRASMSVPGAFDPVEIDGSLLVDGGLANNLPINVARGMGVDVIIAVDISAPLLPAAELNTAFSIADQIVTIFVRRETDVQIQQLSPRDILITPELAGFSATDFTNAVAMVAPGAAATMAQGGRLARLSRSAESYAAWRAQHSNPDVVLPVLDFVRVDNDSRVSERVLLSGLETEAGKPLVLDTLERDLAGLYGLERFETVTARLVHEGAQTGLELSTRQKSWGPNFLNFGLNLADDFEGGSNYNLNARLRLSDLNPLGGEWRIDAQVGRSPEFFTEYYQPLSYDTRFFVAPRLRVKQDNVGLFDVGERAAEFLVRAAVLGIDVGYELGNWGELRVGLQHGTGRTTLRTGDPALLPTAFDDFDVGNYFARFAYDTLDNVNFPRSGARFELQVNLSKDSLGASDSFDRFSGSWAHAKTWGRHTLVNSITAGTIGGASVADIQNLFQVGGFLNLSGLSQDELLGPHFAVGRLVYYRRFGRLKGGRFDLPVYLGGSLELGNVWQTRSAADLDSARESASVFLGVDSLLGPLYVGAGLSEGGRSAYYFFLGRTF